MEILFAVQVNQKDINKFQVVSIREYLMLNEYSHILYVHAEKVLSQGVLLECFSHKIIKTT